MLKVLGAGLLVVLLLAGILAATVVFYNLEDDELDPEVARLLAEPKPQTLFEDNGYFAWIGVVGPADVPPYEWGRRWYEEAVEAGRERKGPALAIESEMRTEAIALDEIPCSSIEACLGEVADEPDLAREALTRARVTLERCDAAIEFSRYQEPWIQDSFDTAFFPYYPHGWRRLQATRFALALAEGRDDEALQRLEKELAFHIRRLRGAATLLDKLLAMANLNNSYLLLNEYMRQRPEQAERRAERIARLLAPPDGEAFSMTTVIKTEWLLAARFFLNLPHLKPLEGEKADEIGIVPGGLFGRAVENQLYLPHATVNEYYEWYRRFTTIDELSDESYRAALASVRRHLETAGDQGILFGLSLRNPVGRILVTIGMPNFEPYFRTRDDLLALRAGVAFQLDLLREDVTDGDGIAQALERAGLVHRFTGEAPVWDEAARTLTYADLPVSRGEELVIRL